MEQKRETYRCPVTGMEVLELEAFSNVDFGNGYFFSIKKVGESIIYSENRGNIHYSDVERHYKLVEDFIRQAHVKKPFVEIRDYTHLSGRPTTSQKELQRKYLIEHQEDFAGIIVCNIPEWLRVILKLTPFLFKIPFESVIAKDYGEAVQEAVKILQNRNVYKDEKLHYHHIIFKPEWAYEDKEFSIVNGVVPGKLFFTAFKGIVRQEAVQNAARCMNRLYEEGYLTGSEFIRIADYSGLSNVPLKIRNIYAETLNELNRKYHCKPVETYICGASSFVKIAIKLYTSFVRQKFVFVNSVEAAFRMLNGEMPAKTEQEKDIKVSQKDIDEIINLSGSLIWSETEKIDVKIADDNPLNQLADTLSLIQEDLIDLRVKEIEQNKKLEESLDHMSQLTRELKESNDQSQQLNEELKAANEQLMSQKEELEAARNKLLDMNANLETLVDKRTKKWKKTVKKLNKTVAKLDRFVYSASHDLSAPLKSVLGLVNIMKLDQEKAYAPGYLNNIENSIKKLEDVIKSLISYSRNNRLEVKKELFNLYNLTTEVMNELAYLPGVEVMDIMIKISPAQMIVTDRQRLKTILHNLINNSIKYADFDKSKPSVIVDFDEDEKWFNIWVRDNGHGIEKTQLKKIFSMFYRGTERSKGSGLGLFIVDETIKALKGKIKVNSEAGKGTEFRVSLRK